MQLPLQSVGRAAYLTIPIILLAAAIAVALATGGVDLRQARTQGSNAEMTLSTYAATHPEEVRRFVTDYLTRNPQALQEALVELMKQRPPPAVDVAAAVKANATALFDSDKRVVLGNPSGDVTLVEFVDYNCGFCRRALGDILRLIETDASLRVVVIEHPVLGVGSVEAARIAIAVQMQDRSAARYLEFHRKLLAGPGPANKARALAVAAELGFDRARVEALSAGPEVDTLLEESKRLSRALGVRGTPSYVVGANVLYGAVGAGALRVKIAAAR